MDREKDIWRLDRETDGRTGWWRTDSLQAQRQNMIGLMFPCCIQGPLQSMLNSERHWKQLMLDLTDYWFPVCGRWIINFLWHVFKSRSQMFLQTASASLSHRSSGPNANQRISPRKCSNECMITDASEWTDVTSCLCGTQFMVIVGT